jgi:hypothetical protein
VHPFVAKTPHCFRKVPATLDPDQRDAFVGPPFQPDRLARRAQSNLNFRTHGHPLDLRTEHLNDPRVALVARVVADAFAEQTRRNADARPPFDSLSASGLAQVTLTL